MYLLRKTLTVAFVTIVPLAMLVLSETPASANDITHVTATGCDTVTVAFVHFPAKAVTVTIDVARGAGHVSFVKHLTGSGHVTLDVSALPAAAGPTTLTAGWTLKDGPHHYATVMESDCGPHETTTTTMPATTTTMPVTTTTQATTTTTAAKVTTTTAAPCDRFARGTVPADVRPGAQACTTTTVTPTTTLGIAVTAKAPTLPFTGGSSRPLGAIGGIAVAAGALTLAAVRKRSR